MRTRPGAKPQEVFIFKVEKIAENTVKIAYALNNKPYQLMIANFGLENETRNLRAVAPAVQATQQVVAAPPAAAIAVDGARARSRSFGEKPVVEVDGQVPEGRARSSSLVEDTARRRENWRLAATPRTAPHAVLFKPEGTGSRGAPITVSGPGPSEPAANEGPKPH